MLDRIRISPKLDNKLQCGLGEFSRIPTVQIEDYLDKHDGGDDFDPQPLGEEGALLGVDLDKLGLQVLLGQDAQVLVYYLKGESS